MRKIRVGLRYPVQVRDPVDHHDPADDRHDHQHADDDPAVERHRLQDHGEIAGEPARRFLVDAEGDQLGLLRPLPDRGQLDEAGGARHLCDLQFVDIAGESGRRCSGSWRSRRRFTGRRCRRVAAYSQVQPPA